MSEVYLPSDPTNYHIDEQAFDDLYKYALAPEDAPFAEELSKHGLRLISWYEPPFLEESKDSPFDPLEGIGLPIVAFNYAKTDMSGVRETNERVMIWDGEGFGVHAGHTGQEPAQYLVGRQIGTFSDGQLVIDVPKDGGRRNFSMDSIVGGDRGDDPIDARTGLPMTASL